MKIQAGILLPLENQEGHNPPVSVFVLFNERICKQTHRPENKMFIWKNLKKQKHICWGANRQPPELENTEGMCVIFIYGLEDPHWCLVDII